MTLALNLALHAGEETVTLPAGPPATAGQALIGSPPATAGDPVTLTWGATGGGGGGGSLPVPTGEGNVLMTGNAAASYAWSEQPLDFGRY
jgi:hypothetical protein